MLRREEGKESLVHLCDRFAFVLSDYKDKRPLMAMTPPQTALEGRVSIWG
jgi:hypothetical protein